MSSSNLILRTKVRVTFTGNDGLVDDLGEKEIVSSWDDDGIHIDFDPHFSFDASGRTGGQINVDSLDGEHLFIIFIDPDATIRKTVPHRDILGPLSLPVIDEENHGA